MKVSDFDFSLPSELIAQQPLSYRAASRLLVLHRGSGQVEHRTFLELENYLDPGDVLVINDTRVIPARLYGKKDQTGAGVEMLLLRPRGGDNWEVLVRPGKKIKPGCRVLFGNGELVARVDDTTPAGGRVVHFEYQGIFEEVLDRLGKVPLPPYITEEIPDPERYQTVYARHRGSAAAPTAGLHFTVEFLDKLREKGVNVASVLLHVGLGTFRPVKADQVEEHAMHSEYFQVDDTAAETINQARQRGGRLVAVGTTAARTLETVADEQGIIQPGSGWTEIFIYPGYQFRALNGLITNFHLPRSTLLMLVSALAGRENVLNAYDEAIQQRYRFFSFGDAMLII
ncbi:MAG: tRNA preQ1(34) S-adenosylmethionine ribosyltransferase-isomerase QueA [Bacillota bacterium]